MLQQYLIPTKDKTHPIAWRKRVGEAKAQEITTEAPGVGTRMHKYLEDYVEYGTWKEPEVILCKTIHMMATQIKENALSDVEEIWGSEVAPQMYAGTTDLVGTYKGNLVLWILK